MKSKHDILKVLLSIDTEEFDLPLEHGGKVELVEGIELSSRGVERILDIFKSASVRATFFCTVNFAEHARATMQRIIAEGHEVASHGVHHWQPQPGDALLSHARLQELCGIEVHGYRHPRMMEVDGNELASAGYLYNSSLHPTLIPGRYNHLDQSRTPFVKDGMLQIPCSVTPWLRLPVFWMACHHYPQWLYKALCRRTLRHDGQFVVYFHPWEFVDLASNPAWRIPWYISRNSGKPMEQRLKAMIEMFKGQNAQFITYCDFASHWQEGDKTTH